MRAILHAYQITVQYLRMDTDATGNRTCCRSGGVLASSHVRNVLIAVMVLLAAFLFAETIKSFKEYQYVGGGIPVGNAISVSGDGEVFAIPDTAEFTFSVIEEGDSVDAVQQAAEEKVQAALGVLREQGIEDADMKTTAFELHPKYEWEPVTCVRYPCEQTQVQRGFTLNRSVQVKVRDLEKAGAVLQAVTNIGVQSVSGLSFTVADEDDKKAEARALAIEEARAKAEKLASELGVSLVRIIGFNEDQFYPQPYMARDMAESSVLPMGMGGDVAPKAAEVPAGENKITSNVMITYEIR